MNSLAVIEITAEAAEMKIFEKNGGKTKVIEEISERILILKNIGENSELSFEKSKKLAEILKRMKNLAKDYGVKEISVILGSCFNTISNLPLILDQIKLYSGLDIGMSSLDNRDIFVTKKLLKLEDNLISKKESKFFLNLGASSLNFYIFYKGHLIINESIEVGTYKFSNIISKNGLNFSKAQKFIDDYNSSYFEFFKREIGRKRIDTLILECESETGLLKSLFQNENLKNISRENFKKVIKKIDSTQLEELAESLNCTLYEINLLTSSLVIIDNFVTHFNISKISILDYDIKNIVATESFFPEIKAESSNELWKITLDSVVDLVIKHNATLSHPEFVVDFGTKLFDILGDYHQLDEEYRKYLIVASYLHDIGKFISFKEHNKHSCYLVENSAIFGLSEKDLRRVAFLIYAHSGNVSIIDLYNFKIDKDELVKILKVAAILKIAVSLDQSKKQKVFNFNISLNKNHLQISLETKEDYFIENYKFDNQIGLFKYVFDLDINLKINRRYYGDK